jgi:anti-sigma B factor antagonist
MEFKVELIDNENEEKVLRVHGDIDVCTSPVLREQLAVLIAREDQVVDVDLADVRYLDSSGVAVLMRAWKMLDAQGRLLKLRNPSPPVKRVFSVLALDSYLTF